MPTHNEILSRLDSWRFLPQYQLERRADIFFSFYLVEALNRIEGIHVREPLIPEFPVLNRRADSKSQDFRSFKVDYLAAPARPGGSPVFIELKTDEDSLSVPQLKKMCAGLRAGMKTLIEDAVTLCSHTIEKSRPKYLALLRSLAGVDLLEFQKDAPASSRPVDTPWARGQIVVVKPAKESIPAFDDKGVKVHVLSFAELRKTVLSHDDEFSKRFADSLTLWEETPAEAAQRTAESMS